MPDAQILSAEQIGAPMSRCEECRGILSGPENDECKNPECALYVPSPDAGKGSQPTCTCGELYEGRPCAPDCEAER